MDPHVFSILMPLNKMIDELRKKIAKGNDKLQAGASTSIDEISDIDGLKATKIALMKEVEIIRDDWLKAMESFCAVQDYLLTLCRMAIPTTSHNVQGFSLPMLLMTMKKELGQRIEDEKVARLARASIAVVGDVAADEVADVDALKSENTALRSVLEVSTNDLSRMSAAFLAFAENLADIGLIQHSPPHC